ncbi:adaptor protein MecA [Terrilactibacillus sp. BCM23-1]|uniref:Adapter protein MecA n=1 Tax=Terrilactibacillus tamarindi TaxID=2599694 RepID=A0A6N8CL46_9BACI|nr:adaptor protein MecA [Terrilactibacillus tamarindi]MTT30572.1 adaptor protein MecA [Terrilactibacillus tamarindi]
MKIERINENTLKFYISYLDIETRGFDREEIWYNRERSEELFWQMMDEAHNQESFPLEGPLWIQVQALEKGMEIIVTRAKVSQDGTNLELPISPEKHLDIPVKDGLEQLINEQLTIDSKDEQEDRANEAESLAFVICFKDFEDLISLSQVFVENNLFNTSLYAFDNHYFLNVEFNDFLEEIDQDNCLSIILEYGFETNRTLAYLQEYGKLVLEKDVLSNIRKSFTK